ncbi:UDP-N-acetylmuramate dehydrogenase [Corynebacterium terpenotabidum]|uniref:UDP-N-acetylenolpyruvoylglucosamine reductase n=1 Tax=Corynebacterium terpenotabidum Y-11 TaxID=1200352 RepID=S4XGG9_9CORY|nr:UDP-N-acetylmuramate dehydrogenase [Corynebacterium terpenotabidum]AGP31679.1 UDP-N-acetylenolpyruvoylglucosamine reductase [Corynebacterium terpenotabidum Y-11]
MSSAASLPPSVPPASATAVAEAVAAATTLAGARLRDATFADLTTLRVGGRPAAVVECSTPGALAGVVGVLDRAGVPLLVVGGGSNLVVGDDVADLVAVTAVTTGVPEKLAEDAEAADGRVTVRADAGTVWDDLVDWSVAASLGGLECLSGIPGTVGAAPVQNIGAYGAEVSALLHRVRLYDRTSGETTWVTPDALDLSYRYSNLKFSARGVVTEVEFRLTTDGLSMPLRFGELARRLGVSPDEDHPRRPVADVRAAVLALRAGKGMVLDTSDVDPDHDTWSAGSFFTNPVVVGEDARAAVLTRVTARCGADAASAMPCYPTSTPDGPGYKFSAAWLIEHAGFPKGWKITGDAPAGLSTKHTLALTNRGAASSADIVALATAVRDGVRDAFGLTLEPEPVWIGVTLPA